MLQASPKPDPKAIPTLKLDLCYRLFGRNYAVVGTKLVQVYGAGPVTDTKPYFYRKLSSNPDPDPGVNKTVGHSRVPSSPGGLCRGAKYQYRHLI